MFTQSQWEIFLEVLLSQLNSTYGQQRIRYFSRLPYFFENWLSVECVNAAYQSFGNPQIYVNEKFQHISKVDLGMDVDGSYCALELKHIPTLSKDGKSRFLGPKDSNVVRDFHKLHNLSPRGQILCKLLFLYGPVQLIHSENVTCQSEPRLNKICLQCAMDLFVKETRSPAITWKTYALQSEKMYLVQVDV